MKFPYVKHAGKFLPIVPIELRGKGGWLKFDAYVDSGAGYSIFHSDVATILGIEMEEGEEDYVIVGDGSQIKVFIHPVRIRFAGEEFEATIGSSISPIISTHAWVGSRDMWKTFVRARPESGLCQLND